MGVGSYKGKGHLILILIDLQSHFTITFTATSLCGDLIELKFTQPFYRPGLS